MVKSWRLSMERVYLALRSYRAPRRRQTHACYCTVLFYGPFQDAMWWHRRPCFATLLFKQRNADAGKRGVQACRAFRQDRHEGTLYSISPDLPKVGQFHLPVLTAMHALSGCDTTSALRRLGKRTAYSALVKNADALQGLTKFEDKDTFLESSQTFALLLHGEKGQACQFVKWATGTLHSCHDHWQSCIIVATNWGCLWTTCLTCTLSGYCMVPESYFQAEIGKPNWSRMASVRFNETSMVPTLYKNESAQAEVRDITHLYCTDKSCQGQKCPCAQAGLPCIDICTCEMDCDNPNKRREVSESATEEDRDDDNMAWIVSSEISGVSNEYCWTRYLNRISVSDIRTKMENFTKRTG